MPHSDGPGASAPDGTDVIRLTGISATGFHGVLEEERRTGQTFVADVDLHLDLRPAAAEDRLDRTVHYGELAQRVHDVLTGPPVDLIETVAERIAAVALDAPGVVAVEVTLHKPQAPIPVPFTDVAVRIRRSLAHPPVVAAPGRARRAAPPPDDVPPVPPAPPVPAVPVVSVADVVVPPLEPERAPAPGPVPPDEPRDRMDVAPPHPVPVVLALGSNLGPSQDVLRRAVADLASVDGLEVTDVSPLVRTAPVGGPEQPDYLNAVVLGTTTLAPRALLRACQAVEATHGRRRDERWGPRTLDVDVVLHGDTIGVTDDLELPHPRAHERAFVLQPWAHVDPDAVLPGLGGGPVAALAQTAPDRDGIRWIALDWWRAPDAREAPRR